MTGQVLFTGQILSEPSVFLSEPFQFFRSCKRPLSFLKLCGVVCDHEVKIFFSSNCYRQFFVRMKRKIISVVSARFDYIPGSAMMEKT